MTLDEAFDEVIEKIEQELKPKWTPIGEGLPKENGWYQCTISSNSCLRTMELFYKNGKWLDNRRLDMFHIFDIYGYGHAKEKHKLSYQELFSDFDWTKHVIAWMPLSKPYGVEGGKQYADKRRSDRNSYS